MAASFAIAASTAPGAIPIEGIADLGRYDDRVAFRIPLEAGYSYAATLDGAAIAAGVPHEAGPDYHELSVTRTAEAGGAAESALVRFLVRSSERGSTEWGLPPWIPHPPIPSAAPEFAGSRLALIAPARFPAGIEIPAIAIVEGPGDGRRAGVNGTVAFDGIAGAGIPLFRGIGSGTFPAAAPAATIAAAGRVGPLEAKRSIAIDAATSWRVVAGAIDASADWGEDARIDIAGDVTVAASATVSVGAGSVVRIARGADITVDGALEVSGTRDRPVTFTPAGPGAPWGGFVFRAGARTAMTGAILTGSGEDPTWFDTYPDAGSTHRKEQALLWLGRGVRADLTDCWLLRGKGQAGHGEGAFPTLTRCLVQGFLTGGQFNSGGVTLDRTALIEFPRVGAPFADGDNDGIYLTGGSTVKHVLRDCLIGWALDDGVDAGGGGMTVEFGNCWIESCYHDGFAMSDGGLRTITGCTVLDCGQGIECGFNSSWMADTPVRVVAEGCLATANLVGARFGDSYDWSYLGSLAVADCLLLHNRRDAWAQTWDLDAGGNPLWSRRIDQTDIRSNILTAPSADHPANSVWDPAADAGRLDRFRPAAGTTVGIGIALRGDAVAAPSAAAGIPVRLSAFAPGEVSVGYRAAAAAVTVRSGVLRFLPGRTLEKIPLDGADLEALAPVVVSLADPAGGEITGRAEITVTGGPIALIPAGSAWMFLDDGVDRGTAWREKEFPDGSWKEGLAELGHGDSPVTEVDLGPSGKRHTVYFRRSIDVEDPGAFRGLRIRLLRDDGAIVWINGREAFRSNMAEGEIGFGDNASEGVYNEDEEVFVSTDAPADLLEPGRNVVAVEVHQVDPVSSDLSFDLEVLALPGPSLRSLFIRGDADGDRRLDVSDPIGILLVLFAGHPSDCEDALDADDSGTVSISDTLRLLGHLFLDGPAPPMPYPAIGIDTTGDGLGCSR